MELSEFISATLVDIQNGVAAAIAATSETRGVINPVFGSVNDVGPEHVQKVSFDVAITATEKSSKAGRGRIQVAVVKLGAEGTHAEESSRVSRVQFTIPLVPPVQTVLPDPNAPPGKPRNASPTV